MGKASRRYGKITTSILEWARGDGSLPTSPSSFSSGSTSPMSSMDFDCPICLSKLRRPVRLPCSHAFCRECLKEAALFGRHSCALCRADPPETFRPHRAPVDRSLETMVQHQVMIESDEALGLKGAMFFRPARRRLRRVVLALTAASRMSRVFRRERNLRTLARGMLVATFLWRWTLTRRRKQAPGTRGEGVFSRRHGAAPGAAAGAGAPTALPLQAFARDATATTAEAEPATPIVMRASRVSARARALRERADALAARREADLGGGQPDGGSAHLGHSPTVLLPNVMPHLESQDPGSLYEHEFPPETPTRGQEVPLWAPATPQSWLQSPDSVAESIAERLSPPLLPTDMFASMLAMGLEVELEN